MAIASGHQAPVEARPQRPAGPLRRGLEEAGELVVFSARTLLALRATPRYASEVLRQSALLVRGTTLFLVSLACFFGATIVNYAFFFLRTVGASDYTGIATGLAGVRLGAILVFCYVFTSKVACGIVAEIASAKINEELDAYESEGVDPLVYVVATRVAAAFIYMPIAAIVALAGYSFGAWFDAVVVIEGLTSEQLYSVHWSAMGIKDVLYIWMITGTTGMAIILTAGFYGMRTRVSGGPAEVGSSVARSLVVNLTLAHVIPAIFVMSMYGVQTPDLFIGG